MRQRLAYGARSEIQASSYPSGLLLAALKSRSHGRAPIWSKKTQSEGTSVRHCSSCRATRCRTNGADGDTTMPVWSPYATVTGIPFSSSTATSFACTDCIVGDAGSHQLEFEYG